MKLVNVFISGHNGAGKDTFARTLFQEFYRVKKTAPPGQRSVMFLQKFAQPIRRMITTLLKIDDDTIDFMKEKRCWLSPHERDVTFRQVMINFSEFFMKGTFGSRVFGRIAASNVVADISEDALQTHVVFNVFSDCRFPEEVVGYCDDLQTYGELFVDDCDDLQMLNVFVPIEKTLGTSAIADLGYDNTIVKNLPERFNINNLFSSEAGDLVQYETIIQPVQNLEGHPDKLQIDAVALLVNIFSHSMLGLSIPTDLLPLPGDEA